MAWNLIVKTWIKTFPKFIPETIRDKLILMFNRFCIPLLKVRKSYVASGFVTAQKDLEGKVLRIICEFVARLEIQKKEKSVRQTAFKSLRIFSGKTHNSQL